MSAVVLGESMIEILKGDDDTVHRPGSPLLNTAIGLTRLGRHVRFVTDFGADYDGDIIQAHLTQNAVETVVRPAEERTIGTMTTNIARVGTGVGPYSYENISFDVPEPPQTAAERLDLELFAPRAALFGSLACQLEPGADRVLEWVRLLREQATVFFDPNIRPMVTPDLDSVRARVEECIALSDVIKASEKDILVLYGTSAEFDDIAEDWLSRGPSVIAITHGHEGSILYSKAGAMLAIPSPGSGVIDPTGGGEAYMAALMDCLSRIALDTAARREELQDISEASLEMLGIFATAAASIVIRRRGSKMPTRDELMDQYQSYRSNPAILM